MRFLFYFVLALAFLSPSTPAASEEEVSTNAYARGDFERALREWSSLARRGDKHAQHNIGVLYFQGLGIKQNRTRAIAWFKRAASKGYAPSQHNLGWIYETGIGTKRNLEQAQSWYGLAAAQHFGASEARLGVLLFQRQIYDQARKYLSRASMLGVASAQFLLGTIYDKGLGTVADPSRALRWYRAASNNGSGQAAYALAQLYSASGKYNKEQVANLMSQAAERGILPTTESLDFLLTGASAGASRDRGDAEKFFAKAADGGYGPAASKLSALAYNERAYDEAYFWLLVAKAFGQNNLDDDDKADIYRQGLDEEERTTQEYNAIAWVEQIKRKGQAQ